MKKAYLNWSSGKDAAYALYLFQQQEIPVQKLVTTINSEFDRVSMHGLRKELLLKQVEQLQIPLQIITLPGDVPLARYNEIMEKETCQLKAEGFTHSIFGDVFLEDLRAYREQQLQKVGITAVFPLWKKNTAYLMKEFLAAGFKAITVSVNAQLLDASFCGRIIDQKFLSDLPEGIDPAGENGEFHSFVFDGPIFSKPVTFQKGEIVERSFAPAKTKEDNCFKEEQESWDTRFYYRDLLS
ncbi:adenine nucleotide alpha hydrolase [Salinimicrobium oceani]|uniref:Adenine nucleotide alpha hydrolase n=1 Tax=Salinimicrobium oceani TaxID=2722702 RepID=A0ABX1D1S0_9FLAO|nr:adenine nucleotide alpha hydrolase [Salinimicrobium oceani]NJW52628.1 adenine nucleotide alpha hydrolase [Salinimicrobium oceani]